MIQEIASVEGIAGYDASVGCLPQLSNTAGESLSLESFSFYAYGSFNSQYNSLFVSGQLALVEGTHITEDMSNAILLSRECVEQNGLKIGDTVIGKIWDPSYDNPEVEMELVGVFDIVADKDDEANLYDDSSLWDFTEYAFCSNGATTAMAVEYSDGGGIEDAFFYVTDAAQLNNIIEEVQKISSINWNNYTITANDEVYQNISSALSDTGTLITTLIIVITAVSMVLIILILSMSIRSRKRETGILLAVGIAKPAVILQYVLETLLIAVVAFPLAYLSSKQVAGTLGYAVRKSGGECHRHAGAFHVGGYRRWYPAGGGGAGIQYLDHAVEAQADFGADGVKEAQYEFRNTSGFAYREKMEKDIAGVLPALDYYHFGVVRPCHSRRPGRTIGGTAWCDRGPVLPSMPTTAIPCSLSQMR